MSWANLLSGLLGALIGSSASLGAVWLDHRLKANAERKRTLNSLLRELGGVRRSLESWADRRRGDWSWQDGGPIGVRATLQIVERLPVEVSELPAEITRLVERVENKLTVFHQTCLDEYAKRMTLENGFTRIRENEPALRRVVTLAEQAVSEIRLAEAACTKQWDDWQTPFYRRPIALKRRQSEYQGPRRLPGFDID